MKARDKVRTLESWTYLGGTHAYFGQTMIGRSTCTVWKDAPGDPNCQCNDFRVLRDAVGEEGVVVVVDVIQSDTPTFYTTNYVHFMTDRAFYCIDYDY